MSDVVLDEPWVEWLGPFLLIGLCDEEGCYGHEPMRKMADLGIGTTHPRTMYRVLRQMEEEGMLVSEHDGLDLRTSQRRFSITESGEAYLEFWVNSLARYQKAMYLFFRTYHSEKPEWATYG
jgi:PadR family transcriptional regulator, regulatory protein PadR